MKSFEVFTLIILVLVTFNADISAKISSRIEGRVVDYDTGEPLKDVEVLLYYYKEQRSVANRITKTDTKGCFSIFPRSKLPRRFFMNFKKQGYCDFIKKSAFKSSRNPQKALNLATIAEGERRFFDIKLRKGCLIKGTVYIKDQTGVRP
ncbi:MAG: hypothetical protein GY757_12865, partial [bacterium]|nr:hypothetical protein [bacterium]